MLLLKRWGSLYKIDLLLSLVLILLPLLFFWRLITPIEADRQVIKSGDFTEQYFPLRAFSAGEWVAGRVPLWNPYLFGGQPGLADIQSGALYPPHLAGAFWFGWRGMGYPLNALTAEVIWHFMWAGLGAYWFGRRLGLQAGAPPPVARFMGMMVAVVFTFSGFLTGFPVQQMTVLAVSAWLPWLLLTLDMLLSRVLQGDSQRRIFPAVGWLALVAAAAMLAGHPQTTMYLVYLSLAYTLFQIFSRTTEGRKRLVGFIWWGVGLALGGMIAAAQLLPTLQFIRHSLRADLDFQAVSAGLPLSELMTILYPGYFGGSPAYVGVFPLMLAAATFVLAGGGLRRNIWFWWGVALAAMVLAFGGNTFLYPLLYLLAPGFDAVRQQERVYLLYAFALAVNSGYGLLLISRAIPPTRRADWQRFGRILNWVGVVALVMTGLFIFGAVQAAEKGDAVNLFNGVLRHHIFGLLIFGGGLLLLRLRPRRLWRRWWGMALVIGWAAFNLFSINWQFNLSPPVKPPLFTPQGTSLFLIEHTHAQSQPVRIAGGGYLRGGNNAGSVYGLEDVTGNTPLQLADSARFAQQMPAWRYWQLLNVLYVVTERDITAPGLALRYEGDEGLAFEVGDPFPRARLVYDLVRSDDWSLLAQDETDLKQVALVSPAQALPAIDGDAATAWHTLITAAQPGYLALNAETEDAGLLVVSNIYDPGWQATVDGKPSPVVAVNGVLQGVHLAAGNHQVTLTFRPVYFTVGVWISLLGLAISLFLIGRGVIKLNGHAA